MTPQEDPLPGLIRELARQRRIDRPLLNTAVRVLMSAELDAVTEATLTEMGYQVVAEEGELEGFAVPLTRARVDQGLPYDSAALAEERELLGVYGFLAVAREQLRDLDSAN